MWLRRWTIWTGPISITKPAYQTSSDVRASQTNEYKYKHSSHSFSSHSFSLGSILSQQLSVWTGRHKNNCECHLPTTFRLIITTNSSTDHFSHYWLVVKQRHPMSSRGWLMFVLRQNKAQSWGVGGPWSTTGGSENVSRLSRLSCYLVTRFVVTAAHCVSEVGISLIVTLGKVIFTN